MRYLAEAVLGFLVQIIIWSNAYYIPFYIARGKRKGQSGE